MHENYGSNVRKQYVCTLCCHPAKNVPSMRHKICYYSINWKCKEALLVYSIENLWVGAENMYLPSPFK